MQKNFLWEAAGASPKKAIPVLSFPAAQPLGITVNQLVHSAELQAQAMAYVAEHTPTAAAISLMDLSVEAEAFGATVHFSDDDVPNITGQLIADEEAAKAMTVPPFSAGRASLCVEAVRLAKARIHGKPVLAGVIGPYSLAGRLMDVTEIMYTCYDDPDTVHLVLDKVTDYIIDYCKAFRDAGADGVMMAEPLAGLLNADMAREFSCAYVSRIIEAVQREDFLVVYHNCGNAVTSMLPEIFAMKAAGYHFGNAVDMAQIMAHAPADALCMGNLDPAGQFANGTTVSIREATRALMERCGGYPNFIPSSGCDIPAHAKWENINAFFDALSGLA
ncbi:MAG TPA: uroporphyrinogen decarboxylase family protein [Candidatus Limiplasma sp.]|nr:uroporphyrinogen decarboxylase family protein [Candidatus Limiplasma sp.]